MSTVNDERAKLARAEAGQLASGDLGPVAAIRAGVQVMLSISYQLAALTEAVDALRFDR